jgi:hypothetical protein
MAPPRPVLFIGPSLPPAELAGLLEVDVDIRPPVKRGDMDALSPAVGLVVIVDGVFLSEQAVSPREILAALRRGVRVIGASSMGALRAAELDALGMEGIGEVYRMYASGEIDADSDVALTFHPETGRAVTEPVVNVVYLLRLAVAAGALAAAEAAEVLRIARSLYFPDLTYPYLIRRTRAALPAATVDRLAAFIVAHASEGDVKRLDAITAIRRLNEVAAGAILGGLRGP